MSEADKQLFFKKSPRERQSGVVCAGYRDARRAPRAHSLLFGSANKRVWRKQ